MQRARKRLMGDNPVTWLFYGDSITHGAVHTSGWRDYTELFAERVRSELGRPLDVVINNAISGNTTIDLLETFDRRVSGFNPDIMFLMIGMNDASDGHPKVDLDRFVENLHALCAKTESLDCLPILQTTSLILPGTSPDREPHLPDFMNAVREVAAMRKLPLVDHTAYWEAHIEKCYLWNSNEFHPNEMGHRVFARHLFEALDILDPESPTCRLFVS